MVRPKGAEAPIVSAGQGPRAKRATSWIKPGQLGGLAGWRGILDRDTGVPLRLWGDGAIIQGSVADAAIAEQAARAFLAQHVATLAPGARASDFELVSNQLDRDVRSVGFVQRANGLRVLGGTIGLAFKADRIALVSSTALPHVDVIAPMARIAPAVAQRAATEWLAADGVAATARATASLAPTEAVIVPIVRPRIAGKPSISYRVAEQVVVDASTGPGRWNVWIDSGDGSPIARRSTIHWGSGVVTFNVPERGPHSTRREFPAAFARHTVDGTQTNSTLDGAVTWAGTNNATVAVKVSGQFIAVVNQAGAASNITDSVSLANNGTVSVNHADVEFRDAQLNAFIHANIAKEFTRTRLNPNLGWLGQQLGVFVNENDTCNAFSTGDDIHFFITSQQCQNTARLADVVYHEFGHSLHANSIIPGVGDFDGGLSEGMSDTLSLAITGDPGMGRGFFHSNAPLRNLDPATDKRWPEDATGQPHNDGEIIGGTMYDLKVALETKLGQAAGYEQWLKIMYAQFQRASDIPSTYAEALLADDDDGNVANGTPNQCEINDVFGRHGLADPSLTLGIGVPVREGLTVRVATTPASQACPGGAQVESATLDWKVRGGTAAQIPMTLDGDNYVVDIPSQGDGTVVQYKVSFTLSNGNVISYPQNPADPFYEMYIGPVETVRCFGFESAADVDGWIRTSDWQLDTPLGLSTDPSEAFAGAGVFGMDLTNDGAYRRGQISSAETPEIDLAGNTHVRLQFQRWLGVEDAFFDRAQISANGQVVWSNFASSNDPGAGGTNHVDQEWRFQDIDLASVAASGKVKLSFTLMSDEGLEFGGWTLDDVCIVSYSGISATCGNTQTDEGESCDDGNRLDGDGCSANCQIEGEDGGGCCSAGGGPEGALFLSTLTAGLLFVRRRRRA